MRGRVDRTDGAHRLIKSGSQITETAFGRSFGLDSQPSSNINFAGIFAHLAARKWWARRPTPD
jgi:hypothetical protein